MGRCFGCLYGFVGVGDGCEKAELSLKKILSSMNAYIHPIPWVAALDEMNHS
jgi:hypothetical protein